ncbi:MAG: glycerophosphodiester phosphodiesterase family protein [Terracidiphilus sp.]
MMKRRWLRWVAGVLALAALAGGGWTARHRVLGNAVALLDLAECSGGPAASQPPVDARLVAHAGGAVNGFTYTNTLDALNESYRKGYRVFEVDFHWTSDGRLVLVHEWKETSISFGARPHVYSYEEFLHARRVDGLRQMTFEELRGWLQAHRDALLVTDTKASNPRLLRFLAAQAGDVRSQLIVQVYRTTEIAPARRLGVRAVWLTVYRYAYPAWALGRIPSADAAVIPMEWYPRYRQVILSGKMRFYLHTVPAGAVEATFRELPGIYGLYVD